MEGKEEDEGMVKLGSYGCKVRLLQEGEEQLTSSMPNTFVLSNSNSIPVATPSPFSSPLLHCFAGTITKTRRTFSFSKRTLDAIPHGQQHKKKREN